MVAKCALAAVGLDEFTYMVPEDKEIKEAFMTLVDVCGRDDTLYSYKNARIASIGDTAVACLISYPGDNYEQIRRTTYTLADFDESETEMETGPGEYYLDSLAVLPAYRGNQIGKTLLRDGIDKAIKLGYKRVTLLVEKDHERLKEYYASLGFVEEKEMMAFGARYIKMAREE